MNKKPYLTTGLFFGLGGLLFFMAWREDQALRQAPPDRQLGKQEPQAMQPSVREQVRTRAWQHLDWAEHQTKSQTDQALQRLNNFFAQAKTNVPRFVDDALGWRSKWLCVTDHVPWLGTDQAQRQYLDTAFAKHIFAVRDLQATLEQLVGDFLEQLRGTENEMLLRLRIDLEALPDSAQVIDFDPAALQQRFEQAIADIVAKTNIEHGRDVAQFVGCEIVAYAATRVIVRLSVSVGVLGTSAAAGTPTLGISIVVGIGVDWLVSRWRDSEGRLTAELCGKLDDMHRQIARDGKGGLQAQLHQLGQNRAAVRRQAMLQLLESERKP